MKKDNELTFLDSSLEKQKEAVENFSSTLTDEEYAGAMSDEFAYLDEE